MVWVWVWVWVWVLVLVWFPVLHKPSKSEHPSKMQETTPANRSTLSKMRQTTPARKRPQQIGAPCQTAGNDLSKSESKRAESLKSKHLGMADSRLSCSLSMHPSCEQSWVEIQLDRQSRKLGPARWWIPVLCTIYCIRVRQRPRRTDARKQEEGVLRWA